MNKTHCATSGMLARRLRQTVTIIVDSPTPPRSVKRRAKHLQPLEAKARSYLRRYCKTSPRPRAVSCQDWEIEHVVDRLCRDSPHKPRVAIEKVITAYKETIQSSSGDERLIDCSRRNLSQRRKGLTTPPSNLLPVTMREAYCDRPETPNPYTKEKKSNSIRWGGA
jgi:hypothetical protein